MPRTDGGEDDVDDAAHRLAAKPGARRPLDDLHLLDHAEGNAVQRVRRSQSAEQGYPIEEHQRVHALEAVDLEGVGAADPAAHGFAHAVGEVDGLRGVVGWDATQGAPERTCVRIGLSFIRKGDRLPTTVALPRRMDSGWSSSVSLPPDAHRTKVSTVK